MTQTPPSLLASAARIFDLSLSQMLWSRRSVFLALVVGGPVLLSLGIRVVAEWGIGNMRVQRVGGPALFGTMIWLLYIRFIVPVLGVFYGTALIADEVEDKTITYLFTRPIPRSAVLLGKYAAYLVCTLLLILPSVVIVYFVTVPIGGGSVGAEFPALGADLATLWLGLAAYGALFAFVGARFKRPIVIGLIFVFGWESLVQALPGYLKQASIAYYLQGLVPQAMPAEAGAGGIFQMFNEAPSLTTALAALVVLTGVMLWLAGRTVQTREFVLDQ